MILRFTQPDEFLKELELDRQLIQDRIVRVTNMLTPGVGGLTDVFLACTCIVRGHIVEMSCRTGELMGHPELDEPQRVNADRTKAAMVEKLHQLGLEVRMGHFVHPGALHR